MDFTSDSRLGSQQPAELSGSASASTTASTGGLDTEQERVLQLQDRRDALLQQRQALKQELQSLESESQAEGRSQDTVFRRTALLDLAELVPTSRPRSATIVTQDGSTQVKEELRHKYDCLPLLNMDVRLQYLQEQYPHVSLSLQEDTRTLRAEFHRMAQDPFQVLLKLHEGGAIFSQNVRWNLGPLEAKGNPTAVLQGCYEFDRLRCRRQELFDEISSFAAPKGITSHTSGSLLTLERSALALELRFEIDVQDYLPFPHTRLEARLLKENVPVSSPNVQSLLEGLMEEYGVLQGFLELCRACFT